MGLPIHRFIADGFSFEFFVVGQEVKFRSTNIATGAVVLPESLPAAVMAQVLDEGQKAYELADLARVQRRGQHEQEHGHELGLEFELGR